MSPVAIPDPGFETMGSGVDRRSFVKVVTMAAAAVGLPLGPALKMAEAAVRGAKPSVIWLHFQECTGCTETLLRTSHPGLAEVILDLVSLDYHETLFAAAGKQAEQALHAAMEKNAGKYVLVVEGSIPVKDGGIYCQIGGRTAMEILKDVSSKAGAVIALGSCASWGGIASAEPNPTGATGVPQLVKDKPVVSLPGCPANPYVFLGTVLQYVALGKLPQLDDKGRPLFAYGRTIHEHCPRRAHFDAGRFAEQFGDKGHEQGWCLYKLGCKGPQTHASCSTLHFGEMTDAWPIGMGHPCVGCTEQEMLWKVAIHDTVPIDRPAPPDTYPPVRADHRNVSPVATGVAGILGGAALGAAWRFSKKVDEPEGSETREDTGAGGRP
ncbi:MAG TPA: hydrogenase small subunit [Vicinamibacteria bacterium]|nr:hydrogenase small subunit [Vicinamibacteria bacterium]